MNEKDMDVTNISNEHLYILYTKFKADASICFAAGTSYASDISRQSENKANLYKEELKKRDIFIM